MKQLITTFQSSVIEHNESMARTTETFTVSLPPAMAEEMREAMKRESRTRSELVREALRRYMTQSGKKYPHDLTKIHEVL